jgi:hypothetical protein
MMATMSKHVGANGKEHRLCDCSFVGVTKVAVHRIARNEHVKGQAVVLMVLL